MVTIKKQLNLNKFLQNENIHLKDSLNTQKDALNLVRNEIYKTKDANSKLEIENQRLTAKEDKCQLSLDEIK